MFSQANTYTHLTNFKHRPVTSEPTISAMPVEKRCCWGEGNWKLFL